MSKLPAKGFTLIELLIFIVVVGAGLAGILSVMNTVVAASADPMVRKQALAIAESLLEEILLKDYANPAGGDTSTVRAQFDDVSQYAGYVTAGGIVDAVGTAIPGLESYNVLPAVTVSTVTLNGIDLKKVTVSVTGTGVTLNVSGYRGNF